MREQTQEIKLNRTVPVHVCQKSCDALCRMVISLTIHCRR